MAKLESIIKQVNESRGTLWIFCGLPYSGKSYLAEKILAEIPLVFVSIDKILTQKGFDWNLSKLPNENEWKEVFDTSYEQSREALKSGSSVLYDSTNHTRASRDTLREVAHEAGAEVQVLYVDTPVEIVWKRWEENMLSKKRPVIDKKLVEMTIKLFEAPTSDENVLRIENI